MRAQFRALERDRLARERVALINSIIRAVVMSVMLAVLGEFLMVSNQAAQNTRTNYTQADQQIFGSAPASGQQPQIQTRQAGP